MAVTAANDEIVAAALDSGRVGRASLDLTEPDPLPEDHPLLSHPGVFLTQHRAWSGARCHVEDLLERFIENLVRFDRDEPLVDAVDLAIGY